MLDPGAGGHDAQLRGSRRLAGLSSGRRLAWWALAILLLGVASVSLERLPARVAVSGEALADMAVARSDSGWWRSGEVARLADGGLRLAGAGTEQLVSIGRRITPPPGSSHVRIEADLGGTGLAPVIAGWPAAGIMLHSLDVHGARLWYWPYRVWQAPDQPDWRQRVQVDLPVAEASRSLILTAFVLSAGGELVVHDLRALAAAERPAAVLARWLLGFGWAVLALLVCAQALRGTGQRPGRVVVLLLAAGVVGGGLLPHPYLSHGVHWTMAGLGSVVEQGEALLQGVTARLRGGTAGQPGDVRQPASPPGSMDAVEAAATAAADDAQRPSTPRAAPAPASESTAGADVDTTTDITTTTPTAARVPPPVPGKHAAHFGAFALLGLAAMLAWPGQPWLRVVTALALLSVSLQAAQALSITREPALDDLLHDALGLLTGSTLVLVLRYLRGGRRQDAALGRA